LARLEGRQRADEARRCADPSDAELILWVEQNRAAAAAQAQALRPWDPGAWALAEPWPDRPRTPKEFAELRVAYGNGQRRAGC
jgi:hypothetical protein